MPLKRHHPQILINVGALDAIDVSGIRDFRMAFFCHLAEHSNQSVEHDSLTVELTTPR